MELSLLYDIGIIVIVCSIIGVICRYLKQPLILSYIITGLLMGPAIFGFVKNPVLVSTLSELGVAFLLFIIGLEIDLKNFKETGMSAMIIGFFQVLFTTILGFFIGKLIGFNNLESLILGFVISFSSTMIVVKLLSEKNELDSLHGKIMLGVLIMQDILAVFSLTLITSLDTLSFKLIGFILLKGLALILVSYIFAKYLMNSFISLFDSSSELLFVGALSYCFLLSYFAYTLGFSFAIGAFIAGIILTTTKYNIEIASRTRPLRDFFVLLFFANLGLSIEVGQFSSVLIPLVIILFSVIILKPVITYLIMRLSKYGKRTSVLVSIGLGQISEFSIILVSLAFSQNIVGQNLVLITIFLMVISITFSIYSIERDQKIYSLLSRFLGQETNLKKYEVSLNSKDLDNHIIIFGTHKPGMKLISYLHSSNREFIVVDFNPSRLEKLSKLKIKCIYGDMNSIDVYEKLNLESASVVISTVNNFKGNLLLIEEVKGCDSNAVIILLSRSIKEAIKLYEHGASYVIVPDSLGSEKIINYFAHLSLDGIRDWGQKHRQLLIDEAKNQLFEV